MVAVAGKPPIERGRVAEVLHPGKEHRSGQEDHHRAGIEASPVLALGAPGLGSGQAARVPALQEHPMQLLQRGRTKPAHHLGDDALSATGTRRLRRLRRHRYDRPSSFWVYDGSCVGARFVHELQATSHPLHRLALSDDLQHIKQRWAHSRAHQRHTNRLRHRPEANLQVLGPGTEPGLQLGGGKPRLGPGRRPVLAQKRLEDPPGGPCPPL